MCFEAVSKMIKIEAVSHETSLEVMGFKKMFFEAMEEIFGVTCFEHLGKKVVFVKDTAMFLEVKNEATIFEVIVKRILEEVGNLLNEVVCLKLTRGQVKLWRCWGKPPRSSVCC